MTRAMNVPFSSAHTLPGTGESGTMEAMPTKDVQTEPYVVVLFGATGDLH